MVKPKFGFDSEVQSAICVSHHFFWRDQEFHDSFRHHGRGVHPIHVIWIRVGFVNLLCFTDFSNLTKCTWFSFRVDTRKRFGFRDISHSGIFRDLPAGAVTN